MRMDLGKCECNGKWYRKWTIKTVLWIDRQAGEMRLVLDKSLAHLLGPLVERGRQLGVDWVDRSVWGSIGECRMGSGPTSPETSKSDSVDLDRGVEWLPFMGDDQTES